MADDGGKLTALARATRVLGQPGDLADTLRTALDQLCSGKPFGAAHLRLFRPEDSIASGTFDAANAGSDHSLPLEWCGEGVGELELFVAEERREDLADTAPQRDELAETATVAAGIFAARIASARDNTFRAYFENAGVGIGIATSTGEMVRANRAYADFLGRKQDEIPGVNALEFIADEYVPETVRGLEQLRSGRVDRLDLERRYRRTDGSLVWGRTAATRLGDTGFIIAVVQDIDEMKRAEEAIRKLSGRLLHLQDEERRRIARSLHESAAQTVAALSMNLQRMEGMSLPAHVSEILADSLELVTQCSREIRTLSHLLHPPLLEEVGLPSSLRWYVQGFGTRSNVSVKLELAEIGRLPMELEITLFRVVQESLTNVHRHADALEAIIRLRRSGTEVVLEVEDDGIGMPNDVLDRLRQGAEAVGVGIAGMRERLAQLGGTLEIQPQPRGTLVRARLWSER